ncbi:hypothetical protein FRC09_010969 [Ceratobasidium sp. 395]|nr:hypothetical protein FRC09_010969 [Ceratobasidium sp. 395]
MAMSSATTAETETTASSSVLSHSQSFNSLTSTSTKPFADDGSMTVTPKRRYPAHLSRGSPPPREQNRSPTSDQYESMEDLLTAAGYTVTRVFTPDTERIQRMSAGEEQRDDSTMSKASGSTTEGGGIGTLVAGWISHIIPASGGGRTARRHGQTPVVRVQPVEEDAQSNPFLESSSNLGVSSHHRFPHTARSLRTHLSSATRPASRSSSRPTPLIHHARPDRAVPALRHTTSAPSLPRISPSGGLRRRALPAAWRDAAGKQREAAVYKAWSGGFAPKTVETQLKPRSTSGWFSNSGTIRPSAGTLRIQTSSPGTIRGLTLAVPSHSYPTLYRARSAPRSTSVHVPVPAPPVRPSPVVQQSTVVCRSQSSFGSSLSVQTRSSVNSPDSDQPSPILAPETTPTDGLPPTPARPTIQRARSNGFLRRKQPAPPVDQDEREPDLASIIDAFRPPSPTRRQRSIRSLRALLKDPRFPDVPVVCVASPGTVGAGGAGRALWMSGPGWEAEVRRKNTMASTVRGGSEQ